MFVFLSLSVHTPPRSRSTYIAIMAGTRFTIDLSVRQIEIPIGAYRSADPSPNFMKNVINAYNDADVPGRAKLLMKFAAQWPKVLVLLGDHNNEQKVASRKRFMRSLEADRLKRARLAGPLAGPASAAPDVITLTDIVRPAVPVVDIDSTSEPEAEPADATTDPYQFWAN